MNNFLKTLDVPTKDASTRLCLVYEFKRDDESQPELSSEEHNAAAKRAAKETGIVPESAVKARVIHCPDATLSKVHHLPFDSNFHVANGGPAVRLEFIYNHGSLFVRIVNSLGDGSQAIVDGVTASRLAFHTMELLEGKKLNFHERWICKPAPLKFGKRQQWNGMREMNLAQFLVVLAKLRLVLDLLLEMMFGLLISFNFDKIIVNSPYSMLRFYQSDKYKHTPAHVHSFGPSDMGFKDFLEVVESWKQALGSTGYFFLMNFSPEVACGLTTNIYDIKDRNSRYENAFIPAGSGPPPPVWGAIFNFLLSRKIVINNYGVHNHNFSVQPVAFVWDWLELAAPLHVCGCISINGQFLSFTRGLPVSLERNQSMIKTFGPPARVSSQNTHWFKQMGPWNPKSE
jgi:hypothetical protein